jgi:hypothetical protein
MFSLVGRVPTLGSAGTGHSTIPFLPERTETTALVPGVRSHGT